MNDQLQSYMTMIDEHLAAKGPFIPTPKPVTGNVSSLENKYNQGWNACLASCHEAFIMTPKRRIEEIRLKEMRLMLGFAGKPSLLVTTMRWERVTNNSFDFWVVNGAWKGTFTNGFVTIWHPDRPWTNHLDRHDIICSDQNRLRGSYEDVFANFDNPNYVAPDVQTDTSMFDDDIPF